jgi:CheY-like chemotaxis protein
MAMQPRAHPLLLCVDTEEIGLQIRKRMLETVGYKVLSARSTQQALKAFRQNNVDLVLLEHLVPGDIDCRSLIATMKSLKPEVPIAIYSADLQRPQNLQLADAFITKLVSVHELLRTLEKLLPRFSLPAAA